jgi:hypothetical protein
VPPAFGRGLFVSARSSSDPSELFDVSEQYPELLAKYKVVLLNSHKTSFVYQFNSEK